MKDRTQRGYGFGHLNGAPAQIVYRELDIQFLFNKQESRQRMFPTIEPINLSDIADLKPRSAVPMLTKPLPITSRKF
jgi:hypothetical protein